MLTNQSSDMTILELLKATRALISNPANWTQDCCARNKDGAETGALNPTAVQWCSAGALIKCRDDKVVVHYRAYDLLEDLLTSETLIEFNDHHTHSEVLALFDQAIERASAQ